jgi:hypothetical protein
VFICFGFGNALLSVGQPDYRPIKKSLRVGFYYGNGMGGVRTTCFAENLFFHPLKKGYL